jgi:hypothetical protein
MIMMLLCHLPSSWFVLLIVELYQNCRVSSWCLRIRHELKFSYWFLFKFRVHIYIWKWWLYLRKKKVTIRRHKQIFFKYWKTSEKGVQIIIHQSLFVYIITTVWIEGSSLLQSLTIQPDHDAPTYFTAAPTIQAPTALLRLHGTIADVPITHAARDNNASAGHHFAQHRRQKPSTS